MTAEIVINFAIYGCVVGFVILFIIVGFMLLPETPESRLKEINDTLKNIADKLDD